MGKFIPMFQSGGAVSLSGAPTAVLGFLHAHHADGDPSIAISTCTRTGDVSDEDISRSFEPTKDAGFRVVRKEFAERVRCETARFIDRAHLPFINTRLGR
jgi:hypothetical protein